MSPRLRLDKFFQHTSIPKSVEDMTLYLQEYLENKSNSKVVQEKWKQFESTSSPVLDAFQALACKRSEQSGVFKYWSILINKIMSIIQDLPLSFRDGNCSLGLSAVRRSLRLFLLLGLQTTVAEYQCILRNEKIFQSLFQFSLKHFKQSIFLYILYIIQN